MDYSILRQIQNPEKTKKEEINGITYINYSIMADKEYSIDIPLRLKESFEEETSKIDFDLFTKTDLKNLVRKYRGIIE